MKRVQLTNERIGSLCAALTQLVGTGISAGDALHLLLADETDRELRPLLQSMAQQADEGDSLSQLVCASGAFPAYVCALLSIGERVGKSEQVLSALSTYYTQQAHMARRLRTTLFYPAMLLAVLLAVIVVLLVWVLPIFNDVYAGLGSGLTGLAGGLLRAGQLLGAALPYLGIALLLVALLLALPATRRPIFTFFRRRFGDRGAFAQLNSARFLQSLSLAVASGMTESEALGLSARLAGDEADPFERRCRACMEAYDGGTALPRALLAAKMISAADCRLFEAGIHSGHSDEVLASIARERLLSAQEGVEEAVGSVEPVLVGVACLLIGAVLLSVMLPLMNIMNSIG